MKIFINIKPILLIPFFYFIGLHSCNWNLQNSKMKNEDDDNFELITTDEEVYGRIDDVLNNLKSQPNPFLYQEMKGLLSSISSTKLDVDIPKHFPEASAIRM